MLIYRPTYLFLCMTLTYYVLSHYVVLQAIVQLHCLVSSAEDCIYIKFLCFV